VNSLSEPLLILLRRYSYKAKTKNPDRALIRGEQRTALGTTSSMEREQETKTSIRLDGGGTV